MAIREALSWLKEVDQNYVQVESNSLQVIQNLKIVSRLSYFDLIIYDVKDIIVNIMRRNVMVNVSVFNEK